MMIKRITAAFSIVVLMFCFAVTVPAQNIVPYENYTYSEHDGSILPAPQAYIPERVLYGNDLGIGSFNAPTDIHADENYIIYLLDAGNGRIVVLNPDFTLKQTIQGFQNGETVDEFTNAQGIYVDDAYIYIADTDRSRIVILDKSGVMVRVVNAPQSTMLGDNFSFRPIKIVTDPDRLLYVVGEGTFEGIITMDWDGEFTGFVGSNNVKPSVWDIFWMQFSTREQRQKMIQFVPQDFSSIDIDEDGFFFCTTRTSIEKENQMVKRLNPGGDNVIRSLSHTPLIGDPERVQRGTLSGYSSFIDVACKGDGIYACLDSTRGKIFVYNNDGYMLYNFGTLAHQIGGFSKPSAMCWLADDKVSVVDGDRNAVTIFAPTDYAVTMHEGIAAEESLQHELAVEKWQEVLTMNSNCELAHIQVGKAYQSLGEHEQAMDEFHLGGNDSLYSTAFGKFRAEWIYQNILLIVIVLAAAAVLIIAAVLTMKHFKRKRGRKIDGQ